MQVVEGRDPDTCAAESDGELLLAGGGADAQNPQNNSHHHHNHNDVNHHLSSHQNRDQNGHLPNWETTTTTPSQEAALNGDIDSELGECSRVHSNEAQLSYSCTHTHTARVRMQQIEKKWHRNWCTG